MTTIKAPFNFVPVSENVFFPDWAGQISHDIPFEDGESGIIELKITAESPIFVRNGHTKKDGEEKNDGEDKNNVYKSFSKIGDKYFIPATSIKGAIRNVLEIMSFGKMRLDKNAMFAQREWDNENLYPMKKEQNKLFCGYLRQKGDDYEIIDCGKPYRIGHKRIDEKLNNSDFEKFFSQRRGINLNDKYSIKGKEFDPKTSIFKYELIKTNKKITSIQRFDIDDEFCNEYRNNRLKFSDTGKYLGRLVLTGQPDKWVWPRPTNLTPNAGKYYEFVFLEPEENSTHFPFPKEKFNHFKFIYSESPEWDRAKKLLDKEGVPIFFRKTPQGDIQDLGLAFLYKLPYDHSPFDTLGTQHKDETNPDLAECLFGFINLKDSNDTSKTISLKGRVQFSPAFSDNAKPDEDTILTLNSPKASYYPLYIQQNGRNGIVSTYNTYNNSIISGWKRYMVRKDIWGAKTEYNPTLDTIIHPIRKGSVFTGKIRFYNLKKVELGALLSALTFHNTNECYHQLGQGKPYGFGKIKLELLKIKFSSNQEVSTIELMEQFEELITKKIKNWNETEQIKELFTMAKQEVTVDDVFKYMHMDNVRENNEFLLAKNFREFMCTYSILTQSQVSPVSLVQKKYEELIKTAKSFFDEKKYIESKNCLKEAEKLLLKNTEHSDLLAKIDEILEQQRKEEDEKRKQKEIEENRQKKIESGLSFLEEKNLHGQYKVTDFKGAKVRIDQWMTIANVSSLSQEHWDVLFSCISRLIREPDRREVKLWKDFNSHIWKTISGYIGEEKAKEWFNELNK
ncbi:MAG: TIGR03986 family CRISPR-associated RAMP protein [Dysgonamonadaceae bacterium]|jgi:CRISPR-associated protein (TIGR03986 family)|nr:TIGR03986 family CRISPR-associated RAMP protein [Dysgonamonadaceae bacterium]